MSHLPLRFALRYLFARKSHNVINGHYILAQKGKKNYFIVNII